MVEAVTLSKGRRLRVAVISDLHVFDGTQAPRLRPGDEYTRDPSRISTTTPRNDPIAHPITGLVRLAETEGPCDLLLSCGDIGDRASPSGIGWAWEELNRLAEALGARLVATIGNHDRDSYHLYNTYDSLEAIKALDPPFPDGSPTSSDKYWARHFAVADGDAYRVVTLDSTAHQDAEGERKHGRVSTATVRDLMRELSHETSPPTQILVCHHHPHRFGTIDLTDYSEMAGGSLLLEELGSGHLGHWTVIHGHKHYPHLCFAAGGSSAPVVFCAASVAASFSPEQASITRNQFYIVDFLPDEAARLGLGTAARFQSWEWVAARGWMPTRPGSGLPASGGFGCRVNIPEMCQRVESMLEKAQADPSRIWMDWDELVEAMPSLEYVIPADIDDLVLNLNRRGMAVQLDSTGKPLQVGYPV